jgi:hypothetical protein
MENRAIPKSRDTCQLFLIFNTKNLKNPSKKSIKFFLAGKTGFSTNLQIDEKH